MMKYILKESELRSMIDDIVREEFNNAINEGIGTGIWNTVKNAGLGVVAPSLLAQKYAATMNQIINGNRGNPISNTVDVIKDYFGNSREEKAKREAKKNEKEAKRRQREQRRRK